ncbi:MAG: flagellar M-ring protein FliF [Verrucomicrobiales bacterium]|nr:flagellar M-ring protein FliF [Verrucomicrobiales bacterium]
MNQGLSQLGRQLLGVWKQLGLNQRISIAVTGIAVLAALLGIVWWSSRADLALLYGKLDDAEAARVIAALDESKIPYQARPGGSIFVPSDKVHQVRMQLAGRGIPRGEGVGFEIFDKPNFGISDFVQRANFLRALQGELSRTISELDLVEAARVMIVLPESRLVLAPQQKPTASVFVRVRGNGELPASAVNSIRLLVANAVEGLQTANVSVVDNLGNVLSDNQDDSVAGLSNNQLAARKNLEMYLAKKAQGMLEEVLGRGQAVVRVAAEINWDTVTRYEEKYDPEGQVVRIETVDDENVESTTPSNGGAPGVSANSAETNATASATGTPGLSRTKKKTSNNQYEINRTVSSLMQNAGGLQRVSAAVFVAQRMDGAGAERKPVVRTPEDLQKLRRIVQSALGIQENDAQRPDQITLEEIPFNDQPILEIAKQLDQQEKRQYWMELGQRLIFPALGLAAFFLFWRAFKRTRAEDVTLGIPLGSLPGFAETNNNGNGRGKNGNSDTPPVVTIEVLNHLIRENPANMTQAVRTWMSRNTPTK